MENIAVTRLMKIINPLSIELKLEILSKLSDNLKMNFKSGDSTKENLLNELFGAWSDLNDDLVDEILNSRTSSDKDLNFS